MRFNIGFSMPTAIKPWPVAAGAATYVHTQGGADTTWSINHGLGGFPVVQCLTAGGSLVIPSRITYVDDDNITVTWSSARTGSVLCALESVFDFTATTDETVAHGEDFSSGTEQMIATVWMDIGGGNYEVTLPSLEEIADLTYRITWSSTQSGKLSLVVGQKTVLDPFSSPHTVTHSFGSYPLVQLYSGTTRLLAGVDHTDVNEFDITSNEDPVTYVILDTA